jgi:hypothetical protein
MSRTVKRIEGTLSSTGGDSHQVWLEATVAELHGSLGAEDSAISRVALAPDNPGIPDGEYVLEYFYGKPFHEHVRIKLGRLVAR